VKNGELQTWPNTHVHPTGWTIKHTTNGAVVKLFLFKKMCFGLAGNRRSNTDMIVPWPCHVIHQMAGTVANTKLCTENKGMQKQNSYLCA
jgi:hypothetical protein